MTFTKGQIRSIRKQRWQLTDEFHAHPSQMALVRRGENPFYVSRDEFLLILLKSNFSVGMYLRVGHH